MSEVANVAYGGSVRMAFDYTYNEDSNVTRVDLEVGPYNYYKLYNYDELHRLTYEKKYNSSNQLLYSYDYTYDAVGNRTSMVNFNGSQTITTNYIYNSLNQLMQRSKGGSYSYTYDDNGNMINESLGVDLRLFEYNLDDRMTQAIINEEDEYGFEYELGGKLLLKTYTDGSQRKYYYDGIRVILEKTKPAQGSWTTSKVYTLGGGDIGFIIGEREIAGQNNTDKWYHYDRLGNVMAQTNSSGQASTTYDQDAFGNVLSGSSNGYHLTTKDNHTDIGLYYFYKRWYDPMLGRFIQRDPMYHANNRYRYVFNNPIYFIDPFGLMEYCSYDGMILPCPEIPPSPPGDDNPWTWPSLKEICECLKKEGNVVMAGGAVICCFHPVGLPIGGGGGVLYLLGWLCDDVLNIDGEI